MGELSIGHLLVVLVIVVLLFGAKRIPEIAGSMGKGIKEFKASIGGNDTPPPPQAQVQAPREAAELSSPRPSTSTAMQQSEEIAREPKRLV